MRPGSKVICIDDSIPPYQDMNNFKKDFNTWIKKDQIYTVREILSNDGIVTSILLEEIVNPVRYFLSIQRYQECSFKIERFRELEPPQENVNVSQRALELVNNNKQKIYG